MKAKRNFHFKALQSVFQYRAAFPAGKLTAYGNALTDYIDNNCFSVETISNLRAKVNILIRSSKYAHLSELKIPNQR